jgi:hypothetical protein
MSYQDKSSHRRSSLAFVLVAALALVGLIWWVWNVRSYDRPAPTHDNVELTARTSSVVIPIEISLSDIQTKINAAVPSTLYSIDQSMDDCVPAQWAEFCLLPRPWGGCAQNVKTKITPGIDCHLSGSATLRGPISVGGFGTRLTLTVPVNVSITAKGRGEIGKNIQQTAGADANLTATLEVDIDEDWQPKVKISISNRWDDPPHVWIFGGKISFADKVDPKIDEIIADLRKRLHDMLADLKLREEVQEQWNKIFEPIGLQESPGVWLSFSPQSVGYGGYEIKNGALNMTFMVMGTVNTHLGSKPKPQTPSPLPKLLRELPTPGFDFSLALSADYSAVADQIQRALKVGNSQEFDVTGLGKIKVTFKDVSIYQSVDKALAIGLTLDAQPPNSFFATKGTVWLLSQFEVDNDRKLLTPTKLTVYSKTNNAPVDLLVSLVELAPINNALRGALTYDFSEKYQQLMRLATDSLNRQLTPDLYLDGHLDGVKVDSVVADDTALTGIVDARGRLAIRSGSKPAKQ